MAKSHIGCYMVKGGPTFYHRESVKHDGLRPAENDKEDASC